MPFPCNGLMLCFVNIPTVLLMFFNKFSSCSIPHFNYFLNFIVDSLALAVNSLGFSAKKSLLVVIGLLCLIILFTCHAEVQVYFAAHSFYVQCKN